MNKLMRSTTLVFPVLAAALLAGCGSIGEGSTVQSLEILFSPVDSRDQAALVDGGLATQKLRMFDCFCANIAVVGKFTDGTLANFSSRAKWTSSNPTILTVSNFGETDSACPLAQNAAGMLRPHAPGTAVVTAEFLGLRATYTVEVADTSVEAAGSFSLAPFDTTNTGAVAVQASLPLVLKATLDGRTRSLNTNAVYVFNPAADTIATINTVGTVSGHSRDGGTPLTAQATFGSCSDVTVTRSIRVGDVVASATTVMEEAPFAANPDTASRNKLALNNNESLRVVAALDFNGDGTPDTGGSHDISTQSAVDYTDPCTLRSHDDVADPSGTGSVCKEVPDPACASTIPVCATITATSCALGMTACRTVAAPIAAVFNRITSATASSNPTTFFATFPNVLGTATTLASALGASSSGLPDTVMVTALSGYPSVFPWEATIDSEVVQVVSASGTTLSVARGYAGTTAAAHASGAAFNQRSFSTRPFSPGKVQVTSTDGNLASFLIDPPASPTALYTPLPLSATGIYKDTATATNVTVTQPVTHTSTFNSGSPAMVWFSSKTNIAAVGANNGLVVPQTPCGGKVVIRARATTSTNTVDSAFAFATARGDATDPNGNSVTDANEQACLDDPLCDQVTLTFPRASDAQLRLLGYTTAVCDALQ